MNDAVAELDPVAGLIVRVDADANLIAECDVARLGAEVLVKLLIPRAVLAGIDNVAERGVALVVGVILDDGHHLARVAHPAEVRLPRLAPGGIHGELKTLDGVDVITVGDDWTPEVKGGQPVPFGGQT